MKILLVYPETPATFWSFKDALKFVSKKAAEPPLGLITVAAMLPPEWEVKLIDCNVSALKDTDLMWPDYVFLTGMNVHQFAVKEIIRRCNKMGTKIVGGGPLFTMQHKDFQGVDHFVLNEAEATLAPFIRDLEKGEAKFVYSSAEFPDVCKSPVPKWELLDMKKYASMSLQYSRGCPYDCEFCSITVLNGRRPRSKSTEQFLGELERLLALGYRGDISLVDDNFIGEKTKLKKELLPALTAWQKKRNYPFHFVTEASINLADDETLTDMMVEAGFGSLFIGIETPNKASLDECGKMQNRKIDLISAVKKLQSKGIMVSAGFIIGFDSDTSDIFEEQIDFIRRSGIATAMVGLLNAPYGTHLFNRLKKEDRLLEGWGGNNMDGATNIIPKMNYQELIRGYSKIIHTIYSPREYYNRIKTFLKVYNAPAWKSSVPDINQIKAFYRLVWKVGIIDRGKIQFWKTLFYILAMYPRKFSLAMTLAVYGYHFRRIASGI